MTYRWWGSTHTANAALGKEVNESERVLGCTKWEHPTTRKRLPQLVARWPHSQHSQVEAEAGVRPNSRAVAGC